MTSSSIASATGPSWSAIGIVAAKDRLAADHEDIGLAGGGTGRP